MPSICDPEASAADTRRHRLNGLELRELRELLSEMLNRAELIDVILTYSDPVKLDNHLEEE